MTKEKWMQLLQSKRFWVVIVSLLVVCAKYFKPDFALNSEEFIGLVIVTISYVVALTKRDGIDPDKWSELLNSRKFWGYIVGMAVIILSALNVQLPFNLTPETLISTLTLISGYIVAIAFDKPLPVEDEEYYKFVG